MRLRDIRDPSSLARGTLALVALLCVAGCGESKVQSESVSSPPPPSRNSPRESPPSVEDTATPDHDDGDGRRRDDNEVLVEQEDVPALPPTLRPPDRRPVHDDDRLAQAGIHRYESKRLRLYTDIDPEIARTLPPLADQLYDALVSYFGPLPPDAEQTEFQMTGYLLRDEIPFRELGLLDGLPTLLHGKHLQNRFWLREQTDDYFRRHLLFHECTHCFMTFVPGPLPPVWYMEGMAELFGTHRVTSDGTAEFRILPEQTDDVRGWGRIAAIRDLCAKGRSLSIRGVCRLPHEAFLEPQAYAWSWALCYFFDSHPRYGGRFKELGQHVSDGEFAARFHEAFAAEEWDLSTEWTLFEHQLQEGYDAERAAIDFRPGRDLAKGETLEATIHAARGWQDVGLRVEPGQQLEMTAGGRATLANEPKPWISEPQGISFRYFDGIPLGRLVACVAALPATDAEGDAAAPLPHVESIGRAGRLTVSTPGRLLMRLNDAWDALRDNSGEVTVTIRRVE